MAVAQAVGSAARALGFVLNLITECGLVPGSRRADGVDVSTTRHCAPAPRRRLPRVADADGAGERDRAPTAEDLPRVDRKWKGKTPPNADWKNRPIRKRRICVKGLLGLQPRAIKPRRRAPAAERLQSLSRVVVGDGDRCGADPCLLGKLRFPTSRSIVGLTKRNHG